MFEGFANVWTPILPAREVRNAPVAAKLAGESLVLFRDAEGQIGALLDRCPHRGVALSLGEISEGGHLQCPFHGWSFRADGACAHIPFNPVGDEKLARYAALAVPAREVGGLVWVFTGQDAAGTEPVLPSALVDPRWGVTSYHEDWDTHWTRAMENMLDFPHVPFIHRRTIGRDMRRRLHSHAEMHIEIAPSDWGATFHGAVDGDPTGVSLMWRRPNGMELHVKPTSMRVHIYCIPLSERCTRMLLLTARTFLRWGPLATLLDYANRKILLEDRAVVESSQPAEVPPAAEELSVATDGPTLYFRRHYFRELRGSTSALVPVSRLRGAAVALRREAGLTEGNCVGLAATPLGARGG
ncbi:aromatic ring-hydroxylating oxygenase subunit alpha [Chondromyces crocatus]|uniref:Rieske domain-containing protein n=1 Tax=Chondromyces crocatus TaxID=52 RepID=A0A0K1EDT9_CHOCO|nr:aromatic ring-hydroxylating dioxygenase subunit alpha [Chondromyces crocatus]AKT39040.1 uncharacterized protein CMC5_031860 [Chondromyces crocatus]